MKEYWMTKDMVAIFVSSYKNGEENVGSELIDNVQARTALRNGRLSAALATMVMLAVTTLAFKIVFWLGIIVGLISVAVVLFSYFIGLFIASRSIGRFLEKLKPAIASRKEALKKADSDYRATVTEVEARLKAVEGPARERLRAAEAAYRAEVGPIRQEFDQVQATAKEARNQVQLDAEAAFQNARKAIPYKG